MSLPTVCDEKPPREPANIAPSAIAEEKLEIADLERERERGECFWFSVMDKSCHSSGDSSTTSSNNGTTNCNNLRQLNKLSHKISKPSSLRNKIPCESSLTETEAQPHQKEKLDEAQNQNLQHQPPVYNINKNDFRDVVQKLTGSPAHDRLSNPPPVQLQQPKPPPTSRLHRIRPPPLAHISNRPPPLLGCAVPRRQPPAVNAASAPTNFSDFVRPLPPLSPLPPFPSVHAESPVSAYMRHLQNSTSTLDWNSKQFSGFPPLVSPRRNNLAPHQHPPEPQSQVMPIPSQTSANAQFQIPSSPTPFGCLNSPRSPCPLFSPSSGQLVFPQLPLSPTVPVPSPRWRGL